MKESKRDDIADVLNRASWIRRLRAQELGGHLGLANMYLFLGYDLLIDLLLRLASSIDA